MYITLTLTSHIPGFRVPFLLSEAIGAIIDHIDASSDEALEVGRHFRWDFSNLAVNTWNTNGQHTSWGTLRDALKALFSAMERNYFGIARFTIYDGVREVGQGTIT